MPHLMIVTGSVRAERVGGAVADWVVGVAGADERFTVDAVDLRELALPFMDEPAHPRKRAYTKRHTIEWSERVDRADAFVFVTPEYNYSFAPALKNALDYLMHEWSRKPVGIVSYGGLSGGTRGVVALRPVLQALGLVSTGANVEIPYVARQIADGVFSPNDRQSAVLPMLLDEVSALDGALAPLRSAD
ncbi:NAD(P)H-dependent oxidoreductase [Plantibacter sp. LMC-P-059a]|jgi:NAD(P)H-dependent FMN reductase|uniref:NADPH-dependent FMN reductase n=1 Tax=Plantibacter sp. LMC-P-059a TaxID=3040297 RepID=UPI00254C5325|nr:NAD(P)H-dependent oxidoreductase [Plantibacter sp. LMC-P-059a]